MQKAGLVELLDDDRATLLGALLDVAGRLRGMEGDDPADLRTQWRRTGLRAFDAERQAAGMLLGESKEGQPERDTGL